MSAGEGPFGGSVDVPFSDAALLVVSLCGFSMLAVALYKVIVVRLKTIDELEDDEINNDAYEDILKRSDVSTLTRAERRARAHVIMKEKRRKDDEAASLSRDERRRLAAVQEKAERKLYERERLEQQQRAQEAAQKQKEQRDAEAAQQQKEEANRRRAEKEAREQAALEEWKTFLSTPSRSISVDDWIDEKRHKRVVVIADVAAEHGVSTTVVLDRIKRLVTEDRLAGLLNEDQFFLFLDHEEMATIASTVMARGSVSLADVVKLVEEVTSSGPD